MKSDGVDSTGDVVVFIGVFRLLTDPLPEMLTRQLWPIGWCLLPTRWMADTSAHEAELGNARPFDPSVNATVSNASLVWAGGCNSGSWHHAVRVPVIRLVSTGKTG